MNSYSNEALLAFIQADSQYLQDALAKADSALAHTMAKGILLSAAELVERLELAISGGN